MGHTCVKIGVVCHIPGTNCCVCLQRLRKPIDMIQIQIKLPHKTNYTPCLKKGWENVTIKLIRYLLFIFTSASLIRDKSSARSPTPLRFLAIGLEDANVSFEDGFTEFSTCKRLEKNIQICNCLYRQMLHKETYVRVLCFLNRLVCQSHPDSDLSREIDSRIGSGNEKRWEWLTILHGTNVARLNRRRELGFTKSEILVEKCLWLTRPTSERRWF